MAVVVSQRTANRTPAGSQFCGEICRCRIGLKPDLPVRMIQRFRTGDRGAALLQGIRQVLEDQRWHLLILDLKVVGKNEAGHNIRCSVATLAI